MTAPDPMTVGEFAAELGRAPSTVRDQIRSGRISAAKRGRDYLIPRAELERYRAESLGRPGRRPSGP